MHISSGREHFPDSRPSPWGAQKGSPIGQQTCCGRHRNTERNVSRCSATIRVGTHDQQQPKERNVGSSGRRNSAGNNGIVGAACVGEEKKKRGRIKCTK